ATFADRRAARKADSPAAAWHTCGGTSGKPPSALPQWLLKKRRRPSSPQHVPTRAPRPGGNSSMRRQQTLPSRLVVALATSTAAQPADKPAAGEYEVRIRYQIDAFRNERVRQFFPMVSYLEGLGFRKDPGPEDEAENPQVTRMTGTIGSRAAAFKLLGERHVR